MRKIVHQVCRMNSSKLKPRKNPEVFIIIVNSFHSSIDNVTSVLKTQIDSGRRPYITCLPHQTIQASNLPFIRKFIDEQLEICRITMEKSQRMKDFNQLDQWKEEIEMGKSKKKRSSGRIKDSIRNQLSTKRDLAQNIIVDFPLEHEFTKLYLILLDFYDFEMIKALVTFDSSLKAIVNLFPRKLRNDSDLSTIKEEEFWNELIKNKHTQLFSDVAFLDLDVPVESDYILNLRSKLIYDQFCHFFYDLEDIKSSYRSFSERMVTVDVNVDVHAADFEGMRKRLDKIPNGVLTVEVIYDAILDHLSNSNGSRKSSLKKMLKRPLQVEVFGKTFSDMNDKWREAFVEDPKFYEEQIKKLESSLNFWDDVETVSLEKRQLLNYFMGKLQTILDPAGTFDHLEFYIYVLQFETMGKVCGTNKNFYENRSIGLVTKSGVKPMKSTVSDFNVDYMNKAKIPVEISQLVDDMTKFQEFQSFSRGGSHDKYLKVSMLSASAMIQLLALLMESRESYTRQHYELLDVMLIKFHKQALPEMFSTKIYEKIIPTPMCFRDFNDFVKPEMKHDEEASLFAQGDVCTNEIKPEYFILKSSLKYQRMEECEYTISEKNLFADTTENDKTAIEEETHEVYNVSNERIQFHLTESDFHSVHLVVKASNFHWLNHQRILNVSCHLQDVHLSMSHDFDANKLQIVSLTTSDGTKCILEPMFPDEGEIQHFLNCWNISLTFPNGATIKNLNNKAVEQYGLKKSPDGESKRVLFPNGFVMIVLADGAKRVLASNGSIFEFNEKSRQGSTGIRKTRKDVLGREDYKESTQLHRDSIASIRFLKEMFNLLSFKLTLPSGEVYIVEHDSIVDKLESIVCKETLSKETGSLHINRADGLKMMYTQDFLKCRFPDGTLITTWLQDDSIKTCYDEGDVALPILNEIWWSESKKESEKLVDRVLNQINDGDNFFLIINAVHQIEHKNYGVVRFDGKTNFEMHRDMSIQIHSDHLLIMLKGGVTFRIDDLHLCLKGEMCSGCFGSNEAFMKFLEVKSDDSEVLFSARDYEGNTFDVKKSGRHAFYDSNTYCSRKCPQCLQVKSDYDKKFGERCFILNRDNSGYEILSARVNSLPFSETLEEVLFVEDSEQKFSFQINDADVNIDINEENKPQSISDDAVDLSSASLEKPKKISSESVKSNTRRTKKSALRDSKIIQAPPNEESTVPEWLTQDPSISQDVSFEHKNLIQFYDNPLNKLPASNAVGPVIKLNNKFTDVSNALVKLKTYSSEKFIFNVNGLMEKPVGKKTLEENFKLVVRKTVENHIEKDLECYRRRLADAVITDLLDVAVKSEDKFLSDVDISGLETDEVEVENADTPTTIQPVPIKSFSFS